MAASQTNVVYLSTTEIVANTAGAPLHLLENRKLLALKPVSSKSHWGSARWKLDNPVAGSCSNQSTFVWTMKLPDKTNLLDDENADLLDWLRRFLWSAIASPGDGKSMKPSSVGSLSSAVRYWLPWLLEQGIRWPSEIDANVVEAFIEHLQSEEEDDDVSSLTEATAYHRLVPFLILWRQRYALEKAGIEPMPAPPFGAEGIVKLSKRISAIAAGTYRPLPDEVAIPVLNTAMEMLGTPATDVLALASACEVAYASAPKEGAAKVEQTTAAKAFRFSKINGRAWHPPLNPKLWKAETIAAAELELRGYLEARRAEWKAQPKLSSSSVDLARQPTLPAFRFKAEYHVDLRSVAKEIGLRAGEEHLLTGHRLLHACLSEIAEEQGMARVPFIEPFQRVRQLILAIRSACHIVIQATTGMRISEVCALKAGINPQTGLPRAVKVQEGLAGLTELFIVSSDLAKTERGIPRSVEWVLGFRPKGSTDLPPAVQAIIIMDQLLASQRSLLGADTLFLGFRARVGTPKNTKGVGQITSSHLRREMKHFIAQWVNLSVLPDNAERKKVDDELVPYRESRGRNIKTHQLRKCFGYFASNIDRRLLPVLQMNFHHVSTAMTDGAYTGNPIIERDINDVRYQNCVLEMLETARGSRGMTGRYGEQLEQKIVGELGARIEGRSAEEAYLEAFIYVEESGINRMFFTPYGDCGANNVGASNMACHEIAGTTELARWEHRLTPNWQTRRPSVCAGCACFAMSPRHRPYWEQRYIDNATMLRLFTATGQEGPLVEGTITLTAANADQALAISLKLGADKENLECRVEAELRAALYAA